MTTEIQKNDDKGDVSAAWFKRLEEAVNDPKLYAEIDDFQRQQQKLLSQGLQTTIYIPVQE